MHFWAMVEQSDSVLQGEWMKWSNILGPKDDNTLQGTIPHPDPVIHRQAHTCFPRIEEIYRGLCLWSHYPQSP